MKEVRGQKSMMKYWLIMVASNCLSLTFATVSFLLMFCLLQQMAILDFAQKVFSQTNIELREEKPDCSKIKITFAKKLLSGDDIGKYDLYHVSFSETAFRELNIECVVKILQRKTRKKRSKVFLYDDSVQAKLYASGRSHDYKEMTSIIRGIYYSSPGNEEFLKYSSRKGEPWDSRTIKIR